MDEQNMPLAPEGEFVLFQSSDGRLRIECRFESETLWLSQTLISDIYQKNVRTINEHLMNIYQEGELDRNATIRKFRIVRQEGSREVSRQIDYYNLDAILAVGYRVRSARGTQFRQWATQTLQEYVIKGFVLDDQRLKNPPVGKSVVPDYFDEMLVRIRDIRASERRVYLRIKDIFSMAVDYQSPDNETAHFFQAIQNKLHFACTGLTAAEIITQRANASEPNMGLTSFRYSTVRKTDITIAKNYLHEDEIDHLNRIISMWLDYAEDQTKRRQQIFLKNWQEKLEQFLSFNELDILQGSGKTTKKEADEKASLQYEAFNEQRRRLKEAEGEKSNIEALYAIAKKKD
ncbi:hydroxyacid dehydrogenase [Rahnella sp. AA]|uniref:virulence RhuM family protein n=1 Tax=Rahnella sp. AA TaxID=2057180 RepID=UPI000C320B6B|nr:virulence RhuM family protein [Rahnella sp. AA]PKE29903.1 hydroxyacid dehydrogenase [Rahnella sp. AA]